MIFVVVVMVVVTVILVVFFIKFLSNFANFMTKRSHMDGNTMLEDELVRFSSKNASKCQKCKELERN